VVDVKPKRLIWWTFSRYEMEKFYG